MRLNMADLINGLDEKSEKVIAYYVFCNKLKDVLRKGWQDWSVKRERLESVAEHIYGVQMLAIAMRSEFGYKVNIEKVLKMLAVHEIEEIIIGDLTLFDIDRETKEKPMRPEKISGGMGLYILTALLRQPSGPRRGRSSPRGVRRRCGRSGRRRRSERRWGASDRDRG